MAKVIAWGHFLPFEDININGSIVFPCYAPGGSLDRLDITFGRNLDCTVILPIYIIGKSFLILKDFLGRKSNILANLNNLVNCILTIFDLYKKILDVIDFCLVFYDVTSLEINCATNHTLADTVYSPLISFSHFSFFLFAKFHYGKIHSLQLNLMCNEWYWPLPFRKYIPPMVLWHYKPFLVICKSYWNILNVKYFMTLILKFWKICNK